MNNSTPDNNTISYILGILDKRLLNRPKNFILPSRSQKQLDLVQKHYGGIMGKYRNQNALFFNKGTILPQKNENVNNLYYSLGALESSRYIFVEDILHFRAKNLLPIEQTYYQKKTINKKSLWTAAFIGFHKDQLLEFDFYYNLLSVTQKDIADKSYNEQICPDEYIEEYLKNRKLKTAERKKEIEKLRLQRNIVKLEKQQKRDEVKCQKLNKKNQWRALKETEAAKKNAQKLEKLSLYKNGKMRCRGCKEILPFELFDSIKQKPGKYRARCKKCSYQQLKDNDPDFLAKRREIARLWYAQNKKKVKQKDVERRKRPQNRIKNALKLRLKDYLITKSERFHKLIGCSPIELKNHLEKQFSPAMSWDNYGIYWHIDHIIPCRAFDLQRKEERIKCFNFKNLRPLPAKENMAKQDKLPDGTYAKDNPNYQFANL